ncbi:MAG: 2-hydroxyacid dehydrogenase [Candidatus Hodarchaeota archaeon]
MKVLLPYTEEMAITMQQMLGENVTVVRSERTAESMIEHGADADVVISGRVPGDYIRAAKKLKLIHAMGAGIDKIDRSAVLERGDVVVCNVHENAAEVAEYAVTLLFAAAKNIVVNDREFRKGDWTYGFGGPRPNVELRGKTCLLVGLGNIGVEIASRLRSFGMKLTAVNRTGHSPNRNVVDRLESIDNIVPLVQEADFIILALPLTEDSYELVDEDLISSMKPTALLVNISRGEVIEEKALYDALKDKRILGAGLDVWWNYPQWGVAEIRFPSKLPFHELDNLVMSPHRAAYSANTTRAHLQFIVDNILRFIGGEELHNIVDMKIGY